MAFCYLCLQARKENKLTSSKCADEAFTTRGFANWKDAKVCFTKHKNRNCHKETVQSTVTIPKHYIDCVEMLPTQHSREKADNRQMLYKILSNIQFLARLGLALGGGGQGEES